MASPDDAARRMSKIASEGQSVSPREIEAAGGMPVAQLQELMRAYGVPVPEADEPAFTGPEAEALIALWQRSDVWPFDLAIQISRLYGRLLARIAHATMQLWVTAIEPRLRLEAGEDGSRIVAVDAFEHLLPVSDTLLAGIHRRWLAREATQLAFRNTELGELGTGVAPAPVEASLLFCDLKDFTSFADRLGDDAAIRIIDRFAAIVSHEQGPEARLTKLLGDGFMCVYPNPKAAVDAGARIIDAMRADGHPGVHASVHHGLAIPREGDYFGAAVNLTARLLAEAGRDELVATREVVQRTRDRSWRQVGSVRIRGVSADVELFKLMR
jgi:adenylate cyclase